MSRQKASFLVEVFQWSVKSSIFFSSRYTKLTFLMRQNLSQKFRFYELISATILNPPDGLVYRYCCCHQAWRAVNCIQISIRFTSAQVFLQPDKADSNNLDYIHSHRNLWATIARNIWLLNHADKYIKYSSALCVKTENQL